MFFVDIRINFDENLQNVISLDFDGLPNGGRAVEGLFVHIGMCLDEFLHKDRKPGALPATHNGQMKRRMA